MSHPPPTSLPIAGLVRAARRRADLSQRELAERARVSRSSVNRIEAGAFTPSIAMLGRLLGVADIHLVAVDPDGHVVPPLGCWDDTRDGAGRHYPVHLDTVLDPLMGEWWGDRFGLARPPETFHRDRAHRDAQRARSRWEVRVAKYWSHPEPPIVPDGRPRRLG
jgi:transcriptional regulator with XRE-family HTH domain